jgi:hypothetical protein
MRFTWDNLLFALNACYHVCLEGANLAKINDTKNWKAKILFLDSASAFGKPNPSAKQLHGLEVEE